MRKKTRSALQDVSVFRRYPLLIFLFLAVFLTNISLFFPQNLGNYQLVAGWPLIIHKTSFKLVGEIEPPGKIVHSIVKDASSLMWDRVFLNIVLWTVILEGTWLVYHKASKNLSE